MTSTRDTSRFDGALRPVDDDSGAYDVPQLLELEAGPMAHGGHCVARYDGRVVFVRHAIPGEVVRALVTEAGEGARFWRADAVEVLQGSEFRRTHQWKLADSLRAHAAGRLPVGGAEFGHIVLPHQRRLKAQVFRDTVARIAGIQLDVHVTGAPGDDPSGLHWRTRNSFAVTPTGRLAMHAHRSTVLVPVRNMPLGVPGLDALKLWELDLTGIERVEVATPADGQPSLVVLTPVEGADIAQLGGRMHRQTARLPEGTSVVLMGPPERPGDRPTLHRLRGRTWTQEVVESRIGGRKTYRITGDGFWQVHRAAPQMLVDAVLEAADPQPGQVIADLYAGAGLFTAYLADAVGTQGLVLSVEASPGASRDARRNLHGVEQAAVLNGLTDRILGGWLRDPAAPVNECGLGSRHVDTVVLDPPRAGAGKTAVERIHRLDPKRIVYVSCDPASFARDLGLLNQAGWSVEAADVYDLYPDTHHMESVALLVRH
ncbi:class I SAM-dependent RNA methyltransferase [Citricoccus sp.]|uniref:class I SAM-dependent RNA methyltransferase n=1 Tax=Citricoccus sp. TaxID=1978372 RepID=UPI0026151923|nr:class I SAM-dependent RNA methyltransferase [Citricoccus sp.]HRO30212.1 class I SAM-dependent RNA methyltransferase [Citricoccus sp.]HRO94251.1 class I SAM-dependent RNA methyltransferase [Citricoccus sp.]